MVHLLWTVQAKPYAKALCCKKAAPVLIKEGTIGLNTVCDASVKG